MAKIERKYMAHFINSAKDGEAVYERLREDLEEFSPELAAQVETKKNILGQSSILISGYEKTAAVEPFYAKQGSQLFLRLQEIIDGILVLCGIGVLMSVFRRPKAKKTKGTTRGYSVYINDKQEKPTRSYRESEGAIHADYAFCSDRIQVTQEEFRGGDVAVAFGSLVLDLQRCTSVAPDCVLKVEVAFGSLLLILPPCIRVELMGERAGTALDMTGHAREDAQILRLDGDFAFSAVKIKYMEG